MILFKFDKAKLEQQSGVVIAKSKAKLAKFKQFYFLKEF